MATYQWRADAFQPMSDEYIYCFLLTQFSQ